MFYGEKQRKDAEILKLHLSDDYALFPYWALNVIIEYDDSNRKRQPVRKVAEPNVIGPKGHGRTVDTKLGIER